MMRNTLPCGGGGRRKFALTASSLPRLSAGELRVAHNSLTTVLPVPRLKTCGTSPSMMKMDLPWASWPVTTRRTAFGICSSSVFPGALQHLKRVHARLDALWAAAQTQDRPKLGVCAIPDQRCTARYAGAAPHPGYGPGLLHALSSLRLDADRGDDAPPALALLLEEGRGFSRRTADRRGRQLAHPVDHVGQPQGFDNRLRQHGRDPGRGSWRSDDAEPARGDEFGKSFRDGRHRRQFRHARPAADAERVEPAVADELHHVPGIVEHDVDMAGEK